MCQHLEELHDSVAHQYFDQCMKLQNIVWVKYSFKYKTNKWTLM